MLSEIKIEVTYRRPEDPADSHFVAVPNAGTMVACERHFGEPVHQLFTAAGAPLEVVVWLAWCQHRREGNGQGLPESFDSFLDTLVDLGVPEGETETPLGKTASSIG